MIFTRVILCRAKLASLFGLDQEASQGNESFQYTAPKQPRKSSNPAPTTQKPAPPPGAPTVLFATAVQAFRYINEQYVNQGKLGAAVLGSHTTKEYKLLLYLSQQKQVTAAKIHQGFMLTVQPNNYCTFYDDQRQNWSLMFDSEKASCDFCKEVCLAKANSSASLDAVVVQELFLGEGQGVETGDSLEVVYTGWLLQNHTIGQMFDSNQNKDKLLRLKIGAGKVIKGWEEGMLGMKKAGRRLIVIPPSLAYGSKGVPNRVPPNSTLIFEAELRRVKFSKDNGSDRASTRGSAAPSPAPSPAPSVESLAPEPSAQTPASGPGRPGEPPLRAKSNSLSEQLANPDATKAKLISRMAKMGQPMLPFLAGVTSQPESSDSELEVRGKNQLKNMFSLLSLFCLPSEISCHDLSPSSVFFYCLRLMKSTSHHVMQMFQMGNWFSFRYVVSPGSSDVTSFLMTEARQHNTEIRLAVGKVGDKVDQLASKIDDLQKQGSLSMGVSNMSMETSMIMHNIQRIVQENECLKKEVFEKSSRIEEQNRKIGDLINQNQSPSVLLRLCQVRLTEDLASSVARLSQLQLEASAQQQKAAELQLQTTPCLCVSELKEGAERTQTQYRSEKQRRKEMELKVNNMEEEMQDLRTDKESLERTLSERKKKWQAERQRRDEEVEELRKSSQQELDNVRAQLRKARTSNDNAASEQLSQLQTELEEEWKGKCEQAVAVAKEQHRREQSELTEQRDALQDKLNQLQEKASLKVFLNICSCLFFCSHDLVKRVMNGVFHSLRGEFDLSESYSGQAVLGVIVTTIKLLFHYNEQQTTIDNNIHYMLLDLPQRGATRRKYWIRPGRTKQASCACSTFSSLFFARAVQRHIQAWHLY
uniref:peptidylprolyl isomerase n=1 Tax=Sphaeramia orbicularis TaxID=375764 RepID=A0A672Z4M7_9TELE